MPVLFCRTIELLSPQDRNMPPCCFLSFPSSPPLVPPLPISVIYCLFKFNKNAHLPSVEHDMTMVGGVGVGCTWLAPCPGLVG